MIQKKNFNDWNLQSDIGIVVEILFLLKRWLRTFLALIVYFLVTLQWEHYFWLGIGLVIGIFLVLIFGYLSYKNTLYKIDEEKNEFLLKKGIWNKMIVSIQLDKIIQVNINQNFIQKIINVYSAEIETAGSVKSEATLKALDHDIAFELKEKLLSGKKEAITHSSTETIQENVQNSEEKNISISLLQLIKYAFTADYFRSVVILLGIVLSFFSRIVEYFGDYFSYSDEEIEIAAIRFYESQSMLLYFLGLVVIAICLNAVRMIIRYFQMKLKLESETTWITYGFFARKNTVLQNDRTQIVHIRSNPLHRKLDIRNVRVTQISSNIETDKKAKISMIGMNSTQTEELFYHIFGKYIPALERFSLKATIRLLIVPIFFLLIAPFVVGLGLTIFEYLEPMPFVVLCVFYFPLFFYLSKYYWKNYGLYYENGFLIKRSKLWTETIQITEVEKIQSVQVSQYFWQKNKNIGNLTIQTAGGNLHFSSMKLDEILLLSNYILYRLESNK